LIRKGVKTALYYNRNSVVTSWCWQSFLFIF